MVPSYALTVFADGECLTCGGFFHGETVHFKSLEFIADLFGGLSSLPGELLGCRPHWFNPWRATIPTAGHDRGLH
jgi:hypothetical protein